MPALLALLALLLLPCLTCASARPASPPQPSPPQPSPPQSAASPAMVDTGASTADPWPRLAQVHIPGDPAFVVIARDVLAVHLALEPNLAAEAGLLHDALRVPSFAPQRVEALVSRLDADLAALRGLDHRGWSVDALIDLRWTIALAEEARQRLVAERRWVHRPGEWLEPVAWTFIALVTAAPDRPELASQLLAQLPAMVEEIRALSIQPTGRDIDTAIGLIEGTVGVIQTLPDSPERVAALDALQDLQVDYQRLDDLPEARVIGAEAYAWRLQHAMLLPWDPDALLAQAQAALDEVDAELARLQPLLEPTPPPTEAELAEARALTRDGLMALYDEAVEENLAALRAMGVLTVPSDLPPLRARETPEAAVPLTGDGGSMSPPLIYGPPTPGWWNVEHFSPDWPMERRLGAVQRSRRQRVSGFGTYAVHEGVPGHHLQLSAVRGVDNPLRTVLTDHASVEGWALYAEELFWEGGGFGDSAVARSKVLRSYRARIRRVFYDVQVETGRWTLQEGADWKHGTQPGQGQIDPDLLRTVQWPTQLIGYFAGKAQLVALREEVRAAWGEDYSDRAFHDAVLAEGCIPLALVRAKLLGEPVPGL